MRGIQNIGKVWQSLAPFCTSYPYAPVTRVLNEEHGVYDVCFVPLSFELARSNDNFVCITLGLHSDQLDCLARAGSLR